MKKNGKDEPVPLLNNRFRKIYTIMKLTLLFCLLFVMTTVGESYSQQKINMQLGKTTIKAALSEFQRQTNRIVIYGDDEIITDREVQADFKDLEPLEFLNQLLGGAGITFKEIGDYIVLATGSNRNLAIPQESIKLSGVVKDEKGVVMPGVTLFLKGTSVGTSTNYKGEFNITLPVGEGVLVFSFIGYRTKEVAFNEKRTVLDIVLQEEASEIDEVVVTGYQTISKERMTGAFDVITSKDIINKGYTNVEDILKGQFAGVVTMSVSGRPGAQASVRIRGINSLDGDLNPMWIVDGMPLQGDLPEINMGGTEFQETVLTSGIGNIPPDEIESITILKDAAATAIYGARAANGVIVITTKRGTSGKSYINVQASYGITDAPKNRLKMMNTAQKMEFERGIYEDFPGLDLGGRVYQIYKKLENGTMTNEHAQAELTRLKGINTNWFDEIFRTGESQNYSVTLSGGDERTQYYGTLSYLGQKGIIPNNEYESIGGSIKLTHDFNRWLRVNFDVRSTIRNDRSTGSSVNPLDYATYANPYERAYNENGNYEYDRSSYPTLSQIRDGYRYDFNIFEDLNKNTSKTRYLSNQFILKLEFSILEGLMFSTGGTFANSNNHTTKELTPGTYSSARSLWLNNFYPEGEVDNNFNNGQISESTSRSQGWTIQNQLNFARGFADRHYVSAMFGQEISSTVSQGFSSMIPEWSDVYGVASYPDLTGIVLTSGYSQRIGDLGRRTEGQNRDVSFYFAGSYSYMDRYVFQGSMRFQGADIIGTENQFSPLWNISGKYNLHNESFMPDLWFVNQMAIRASYGFTGSIDRRALPFSYMTKTSNYVYDGERIMDRYFPANPSIKWQRKEDVSFGLDLSLFHNRFNFTVNYYNNTTRDVLGDNRIPISTGRKSIKANIASLRNKGWELSLRTTNIRRDDFTWTTSFNVSFNDDKILSTYYKTLEDVSASTNSSSSGLYALKIEGMPINAFYGYPFAGIDPYDGNTLAYVDGFTDKGERLGEPTGDGRYIFDMDQNYNTQYLNASRRYLGKSDPSTTGGFSTQFNYKRFSLSAQFTFMTNFLARNYMYYDGNLTVGKTARNVQVTQANRWRMPGDITDVAKYSTGRTEYLYQLLDFRFDKGDYLKCNNISLGYNLDQKLCEELNISRARINLNISNLFTLTKFRGIDPETKGNYGYPSARSYKLSVSIGF